MYTVAKTSTSFKNNNKIVDPLNNKETYLSVRAIYNTESKEVKVTDDIVYLTPNINTYMN